MALLGALVGLAAHTGGVLADPPSCANQPPVAEADGPYEMPTGGQTTLDGSGSSDPNAACGDSIASYEWDLDNDGQHDDKTSISPTVSVSAGPSSDPNDYEFPNTPGSYPISLRVTDQFGTTDTDSTTLLIFENEPVAVASADPNPAQCGEEIEFSGAGSTHGHPDRSIVSYEWDFDYDAGSGFATDATGMTVSHAYSTFGTHPTALRVTDDNVPPKTDIDTVDVDVSFGNQNPVSDPNGPYQGSLGDTINLDGTGSSDPNQACGDSIVAYDWDLDNDGDFDDLHAATGTASDAPGSDYQYPSAPGIYTIRLRVTDQFGLTDTASTTLQFFENEPVAEASADPSSVQCGEEIEFSGANSTHGHPDRSIVSYEWDFDHNAGSGFVADATGMTVQHTYTTFGTHTTALRVTDDNSPSKTDIDTVDVNVSFANQPPVSDPGGPYELPQYGQTTLDGTGSSDPNQACGDSIAAYDWDLDDDTQYDDLHAATGQVSAGPSSDPDVDYSFPNAPGTYPVRLRVTDGFGTTHIASTTVTVRERICTDSGAIGDNVNGDTDSTVGVIQGTSGDDFIKGDAGKEKLRGLGGDDLLCGEGGKDTLLGEGGDDSLFGGAGNDVVRGSEGADVLHGEGDHDALYPGDDADPDDPIAGGAGSDGAYYSEPQRSASEPVSVTFDDVADDGESGEGDNVLSDVEKAQGGAGDDALTGDADPNMLYGGPGGDKLAGAEGNDTLYGQAGADKLEGGENNDQLYPGHDLDPDDPIAGGDGSDTVRYQDRSASEPVELSLNDTADDGTGGATEGDNVLSDVEKVLTGMGDDTLIGSAFANVLDGGPGDDDITGGDAADSLYGRQGDDVLHSNGDEVRDRDYCGTGGEDEGGDTVFADPVGTDLLYDCETRNFDPTPPI